MGRGGGGSGRSFGGGSRSSSRSSGGRSGGIGSSRGGRSFSRPSFTHHSNPHYAPPHRPSWRPNHSRHVYHHYYGGGHVYGGRHSLFAYIVTAILIVMVCVAALWFSGGGRSSAQITKSTIEREPLASQYVITTDWYTDELGWIQSGTNLEAGMKQFYQQTGVQPYLYITDTVNGTNYPTSADMEIYASQLYDELFTDEGHILLLFYEYNSNGNYKSQYVCGAMAKTVMDQEACDILLDYVDHYYYSDLNEDQMFSHAFADAGERIMTVTKSLIPMIIVAVIVLCVVIIAFFWWKRAKAQKNLEAQQRERILNADIDSLSGSELENLENKYDGEDDK